MCRGLTYWALVCFGSLCCRWLNLRLRRVGCRFLIRCRLGLLWCVIVLFRCPFRVVRLLRRRLTLVIVRGWDRRRCGRILPSSSRCRWLCRFCRVWCRFCRSRCSRWLFDWMRRRGGVRVLLLFVIMCVVFRWLLRVRWSVFVLLLTRCFVFVRILSRWFFRLWLRLLGWVSWVRLLVLCRMRRRRLCRLVLRWRLRFLMVLTPML